MKTLKIFGKIFAVIFSIIYLLGLTALLFLLLTNKLTSGNYYTSVLNDMNLNQIKLSDLGDFAIRGELNADTSVKEAIVKYFEEGGIDAKTTNAILENKEIKEVLGNFIGDYVNYTLGGEEPKVSRSDVEIVLTNPEVIKAVGKSPTDQDIDNIYNQLKEVTNDIMGNGGINNDNSKRNIENNINY